METNSRHFGIGQKPMKQIRGQFQREHTSTISSIAFVFIQGKDDFDIKNLSQHPTKQIIAFSKFCIYIKMTLREKSD